MCLSVNDQVKVNFQDGQATLYKIVLLTTDGMASAYMLTPITPGTLQSDRPDKNPTECEKTFNILIKGVHAFIRKRDAHTELRRLHRQLPQCRFAVAKVTAKEADLLATGYYVCPLTKLPAAAFTKVRLSQRDHDRVLRAKHPLPLTASAPYTNRTRKTT